MPKFTISIAVHNHLKLTMRCLASVLEHSPAGEFEVIITDNASTDAGMREYLASLPKEVSVRYSDQNEGFGEPHNTAALVWAKGEYFVVLNNDTVVPQGWLEKMLATFAIDPKIAIVGVKGGCTELGPDGVGHIGNRLDYVEGSCLMIPTALARKHGLFDPTFRFAYFEDSDLSLRLRNLGYKIELADVEIRHERAATANLVRSRGGADLDGYYMRNQAIFRMRWRGYLERGGFGSGSILVRRDGAVGDVLLATPVLEALRRKHPKAELTFVTQCPEAMRGNPVRALTYMPCDPKKYNHFYDLNLAYERDPMKHIVAAYAEVCDVMDFLPEVGWLPYIYPDGNETCWGANYLKSPTVVIHPGPTAWPGRNWLAENFNAVAREFRRKGYKVAIIGLQGTATIGEHDIDLRGKTTIQALGALMKGGMVKLFVGIDSMPMHAAAWAGIPLVGIFGCIDPAYRLPLHAPAWVRSAVADGVGCLGCHHWQSLGQPITNSKCLRDRVYCMERLSPTKVISEAEMALSEYEDAMSIAEDRS